MKLKSFSIENFRRLKKICVELEDETTIFVGENNSGKTSATHLFQLMLGGSKDKFSVYDFTVDCWDCFNNVGDKYSEALSDNEMQEIKLPAIHLDLWFEISEEDLHQVIDILPSLDWENTPIGVRVSFEPKNAQDTLANFFEAKSKSQNTQILENVRQIENSNDEIVSSQEQNEYKPWPKNLIDFLERKLVPEEYHVKYYVLDYAERDQEGFLAENATLRPLGDKEKSGDKILKSLVRIDFLNAQRHLSDDHPTGRSEDLSKRFSRFYRRNLEQKKDDYEAIRSLTKAKDSLDTHLNDVFETMLRSLENLGYPGTDNPEIDIRSSLNADSIMGHSTRIHYKINGECALPDKYNGLGFKNLIFMFVELLDFRKAWETLEVNRPLLHILFIEEPEAHLHAQLQKVFIEKIKKTLGEPDDGFFEQFVITTHSSHILYDSGFAPIRYFKRTGSNIKQASKVLDLSQFKGDGSLEFLKRYMKLTHCDLFFADAAVFVEGNVERMLLPFMIEKTAQSLQSCYLSILEVGGAHIHRFLPLIEFLGITTLIVTDLDSVSKIDENGEERTHAKTCPAWKKNAVTSNVMLRDHFFNIGKTEEEDDWTIEDIAGLLELNDEDKTKTLCSEANACLRVAYQYPATQQNENSEQKTSDFPGRTFEEAFAFENFTWLQGDEQSHLKLHVEGETVEAQCRAIHEKVKKDSFRKSEFALSLLQYDPKDWNVPLYIENGLQWLKLQMQPKTHDHDSKN